MEQSNRFNPVDHARVISLLHPGIIPITLGAGHGKLAEMFRCSVMTIFGSAGWAGNCVIGPWPWSRQLRDQSVSRYAKHNSPRNILQE